MAGIFIPEIGPLYVAGVTFKNLQQLVEQTVSSQLIGTQVNTTLGSLRSIDVFILGAANKPGMYSISALSTLTNAIIKTGGIDISGSLRNIKLKRNGNVVENFDFSSGKQQVRAWNLKVLGNGKIEGTALDVVGKARGYQVGSAVKLKYKLKCQSQN